MRLLVRLLVRLHLAVCQTLLQVQTLAGHNKRVGPRRWLQAHGLRARRVGSQRAARFIVFYAEIYFECRVELFFGFLGIVSTGEILKKSISVSHRGRLPTSALDSFRNCSLSQHAEVDCEASGLCFESKMLCIMSFRDSSMAEEILSELDARAQEVQGR